MWEKDFSLTRLRKFFILRSSFRFTLQFLYNRKIKYFYYNVEDHNNDVDMTVVNTGTNSVVNVNISRGTNIGTGTTVLPTASIGHYTDVPMTLGTDVQ